MTQLTLIIGNKNYSSWSLRPWIFLKQFNIDFIEKRVALFTETSDEELSVYNSDFKVPILLDGDITAWDSLSIIEYISERYLDNKGWPEDLSARALARSISCEMHSSFSHLRNELPMNCRKQFSNIKLSTEAEREIERVKSLWRLCRGNYGKGGEWLLGEFSIADAMFAPIVIRLSGYSIPLGEIEQAYIEFVLKQPHMIDWIESGKLETEIIEADEIHN